ncbi:hypothetical protein D3C87_996030 [compost metagenome]
MILFLFIEKNITINQRYRSILDAFLLFLYQPEKATLSFWGKMAFGVFCIINSLKHKYAMNILLSSSLSNLISNQSKKL